MLRVSSPLAVIFIVIFASPIRATTNGDILIGASAVSQSMGGASIATSLDAIGSCYGNLASIAFMRQPSAEFSMDLFTPHRSMYASISGQAAGSVTSQTGQTVIPAMGMVYNPDGRVTYGICAVGVGGFGVDYPAVLPNLAGKFNPLAVPQNLHGFGSIYSNLQYLQVVPGIAYKLKPTLALAFGLNIDWQSLQVSPFAAATPNPSGYPDASPSGSSFGVGFTAGAAYKPTDRLELGLVFKSPQWMNPMDFVSQYPDGTPARFSFRLNFPMIAGVGGSYKVTPKLLVAIDGHWMDFADTKGFSGSGFAPDGAVQGFGWKAIYALASGFQYNVNHKLSVRAGYNHSGSPVPPSQQFFNVLAPGIIQDSVTGGFGYRHNRSVSLDLVYAHAFSNEESGPVYSPAGAIPGSTVRNELSEDEISAQFRLKL